MAVSGVRVSYHGYVAPRFITGQLNTVMWARKAKECGALGVIASSWARGTSLTSLNAHPEYDWYGLATLSDATWSDLSMAGLRDFDERFAWQFYGLPDGEIGDLLYLFERSAHRADPSAADYMEYVAQAAERLLPDVTRNRDRFELFQAAVRVRQLRRRLQFGLLEIEYFYPVWDGVPPDFKARIRRDIDSALADVAQARPALEELYARSIIRADAGELVRTQFDFLCDDLTLFRDKCWRTSESRE